MGKVRLNKEALLAKINEGVVRVSTSMAEDVKNKNYTEAAAAQLYLAAAESIVEEIQSGAFDISTPEVVVSAKV